MPIRSSAPTYPAMTAPTATSPATRSRLYRQRKAGGWCILKVPVHDKYVRALVTHKFLNEADADDREKVAAAIDLFLFCLSEGAVDIDYDHFA